jgi:hypothetical protein
MSDISDNEDEDFTLQLYQPDQVGELKVDIVDRPGQDVDQEDVEQEDVNQYNPLNNVTFSHLGHMSLGSIMQIGFDVDQDEVEILLNNINKLLQPSGEKYDLEPVWSQILSKYPHPRFLNPLLFFIVSKYFNPLTDYGCDIHRFPAQIEFYNKDSIRYQLPKIAINDADKNPFSVQRHDIVRYCKLLSIYR